MNRREVLKMLGVGALAPVVPYLFSKQNDMGVSRDKEEKILYSRHKLDQIAPDYYIWGDTEPQSNWCYYIGRLVDKGECWTGKESVPCYYFYFSDGICINGIEENNFLRARKATWREVYAAVEREKGTLFGLNPQFLGETV